MSVVQRASPNCRQVTIMINVHCNCSAVSVFLDIFSSQWGLCTKVLRHTRGLIQLNVKAVGLIWVTAPPPPLSLLSSCLQIIERRQNASSTFLHSSLVKKKTDRGTYNYLKVDWQWIEQILEHTLGRAEHSVTLELRCVLMLFRQIIKHR